MILFPWSIKLPLLYSLAHILIFCFPAGPCIFQRRELATSLETRTRFPELVIQEEKLVWFVVVKPDIVPIGDAEW